MSKESPLFDESLKFVVRDLLDPDHSDKNPELATLCVNLVIELVEKIKPLLGSICVPIDLKTGRVWVTESMVKVLEFSEEEKQYALFLRENGKFLRVEIVTKGSGRPNLQLPQGFCLKYKRHWTEEWGSVVFGDLLQGLKKVFDEGANAFRFRQQEAERKMHRLKGLFSEISALFELSKKGE